MPKDEAKPRKRMVVEEVGAETPKTRVSADVKPVELARNASGIPASNDLRSNSGWADAGGEIKEKVEELHDVTEEIGQSVEKSEEIQEEIVKAAEKVEPAADKPKTEFIPVKPSSGPNPLFILIPGVLLLGALLGGVYFYQKGVNQDLQTTPTPEASIEPTIAPTASPSAKLDLTKFPINVQNGSGVVGTAGTAKSLLTKAGFKVGATGNADNYNYTDTIIKAKASVGADFVSKLTTTLSGIYSVAKAQTLPDTSKDDVVVIIGSSKAK